MVTEELAGNPDGFGGFNNHLVPIASQGEEVGTPSTVSNEFTYDVAMFRFLTDNDFGRCRVEPRPPETFYDNAGSRRRYCLEPFLGFYPTPELSIELAYTYSRFHYDHALYNSVTYCETWLPASLDADYRITPNSMVGVSAETWSRVYVDPSNTVWVGGYPLIGPQIGYQTRIAGVATDFPLSGRTFGNQPYIAFAEPDPGGNSYHPGPHREIFSGVQVRF